MGTLHLVATPIGNLEDVTLRALRVLREVERIFAEDTRRTGILLKHHQIDQRPRSLHAHNEAARIGEALRVLGEGGDVALVSDAGTPLVCDPGERLVVAALAEGHAVQGVPGASAVVTALGLSGLPVVPFSFLGYLPRRAGARRRLLEAYRDRAETLVFFEAPHRVAESLQVAAEVFGDRRACVAREMTKLHEEVVRDTLSELAKHFAEGGRGEFTIVVAGMPAEERPLDWDEVDRQIRLRLQEGERPREIAAALARHVGRPRRDLYARAVRLSQES
ncbi:MAG: 16S rRNA (cytidine(1402)-2'-O)-methyltransferase [Myxococcota bacterium]